MAKYVLVYHGGSMPESEADQAAVMELWMNWFGELGAAVIDGGAPTSIAKTVGPDGSVSDGGGANPITGYSLIDAASLDDAVAKAQGCPVIAVGGSVEVAETIDVG